MKHVTTTDHVEINVVNLVGDNSRVFDNDGKTIHDAIFKALKDGKNVKISFGGITDLTSAFLNNAIGRLYGEFDEDFIRSKLSIVEISRDDAILLKKVIDIAKKFFNFQRRKYK